MIHHRVEVGEVVDAGQRFEVAPEVFELHGVEAVFEYGIDRAARFPLSEPVVLPDRAGDFDRGGIKGGQVAAHRDRSGSGHAEKNAVPGEHAFPVADFGREIVGAGRQCIERDRLLQRLAEIDRQNPQRFGEQRTPVVIREAQRQFRRMRGNSGARCEADPQPRFLSGLPDHFALRQREARGIELNFSAAEPGEGAALP